jgi:hypothetical protein
MAEEAISGSVFNDHATRGEVVDFGRASDLDKGEWPIGLCWRR